MTHLTFSFF